MYFKKKINKLKYNNFLYYHHNILILHRDSDEFFKDECIGFDLNVTFLGIDHDNNSIISNINNEYESNDSNNVDINSLIDDLNNLFK